MTSGDDVRDQIEHVAHVEAAGLSTADMAAELGVPVATFKSQVNRLPPTERERLLVATKQPELRWDVAAVGEWWPARPRRGNRTRGEDRRGGKRPSVGEVM